MTATEKEDLHTGGGFHIASAVLALLPHSLKNRLAIHLGKVDLRFSLSQLRRFGFRPKQVLDVGAYRGEWARVCADIWPEATILCVEPQQAPQLELERVARLYAPRISVKQALLGASDRDAVPFLEGGTGSSVLDTRPATSTRPMWQIDTLIDTGAGQPEIRVRANQTSLN